MLDRGDDLLVLTANPERLSGHIQQYTISEDVTVRSYMAVELAVCGRGSGELLGVHLDPWAHTRVRLSDVDVLVARVEPLLGEAYAILAPDAASAPALEEGLRRFAPSLPDRSRLVFEP